MKNPKKEKAMEASAPVLYGGIPYIPVLGSYPEDQEEESWSPFRDDHAPKENVKESKKDSN